jgi:hypothetical protein
MGDKPAQPKRSDSPSVILDAHRRHWHDQEVFLAAQLRTIRQQQSDAALAIALCDLRAAIPKAASVSYRIDDDGAVVLAEIVDGQGRTLHTKPATDGNPDTARETVVAAAILALSRTPPDDRRASSVPAGDRVESLDIEEVICRAANGLTRRKPDPESDPLTIHERQVLVAAAYEGFDVYSARLVGEWEETDEELGTIQQQQDRLAAILGYGT